MLSASSMFRICLACRRIVARILCQFSNTWWERTSGRKNSMNLVMSGSDLQSEMDRIPDGTQLELNRTF
jgi:hypothetical protein